MPDFSHLHVHTQYSLLDGAADIGKLYRKAIQDDMQALAITDHGNMFGVFQFVAEAYKHKLNPEDKSDKRLKVKPIIGCEFYVVEDRHVRQFTREKRDRRYHQVLLAKNEEGYRNLTKLCSLGFIEGLYGKYPRIDKSLIVKYHQGLIATTCCIGAEVPQTILQKGEKEAEEVFKWWLDIFGEDYYIELQRHQIKEQEKINHVLLEFSRKYQVKTIATNDSHYVEQEDANAHDILLCINTGDLKTTPISTDEEGGRGYRFGFPNNEFYFKTQQEMQQLFADVPEALDHTGEIVDKVELLDLKRQILLPNFPLPDGFINQDQYLRHLTYEGAAKRYSELTPPIRERLDFELETIENMGFAGYFLIVMDFIQAGRKLGVFVGPGRGSAAGSTVAYCIGITNIDPIKYDLLFERFLNPDRKSMPDIDTDFDDEGRQKVIDYVVEKYGRNQVAQIVTYGTMAAKMSIKDVARVMDLPLAQANRLAKMVPEKPGIHLARILTAPLHGEGSLETKEQLQPDQLAQAAALRKIMEEDTLEGTVLREALKLEGSVRNTGIHAAGIIIAPTELSDLIPVCTAKDSDLLVTQFEGSIIESAGVIKMDFLGLKTLTIIKDALNLIRKIHGVDIDIDALALDDPQTFALYQKGETNGTFQFESAGMQKYLRELKPDKFDDLIAMNALYRPGPIAYIPNYIQRKHGTEEVSYDLPEMEEYLKDTYGITVYQEQVMLLSQKLAGFTKGEADTLRKAMGKKQKAVLDQMRSKFMEGCAQRGLDVKICEKIWADWEAFASYAFNKSHSTGYALVAYQTAYLKAHYPAEFMAAVLTNNLNNIDKLTFYMEESKRMGIEVLGPDINESLKIFSVNAEGNIRFGLAGLKGVGEAAVENIIEEREKNGTFQSIYDFVQRISARSVNKKSMECLAMSGAFDGFGELHRAQYFFRPEGDNTTGLEKLARFGAQCQASRMQSAGSLFGDLEMPAIALPKIPDCDPWPLMVRLEKEKEVTGIYLSGHPLDIYRFELRHYHLTNLADVMQYREEMEAQATQGEPVKERIFRCAGFVSDSQDRISKSGNKYGKILLQDFSAAMEIMFFGEDYLRFSQYLKPGLTLFVQGILQTRQFRKEQVEFRIQQIQLLEEIKKKQTREIEIRSSPGTITSDQVRFLTENVEAHPGSCALHLKLIDAVKGWKIDLKSVGKKLEMNDELADFLEKQENMNIRISIFNN
jgi:DNA polymerase-3 subunit alpha